MHAQHLHIVQTDGGEEQCCLPEIYHNRNITGGWVGGEGEGRIQCPCTFSDCKGRQVINVCQHFFPFKVQSYVGECGCTCVCVCV